MDKNLADFDFPSLKQIDELEKDLNHRISVLHDLHSKLEADLVRRTDVLREMHTKCETEFQYRLASLLDVQNKLEQGLRYNEEDLDSKHSWILKLLGTLALAAIANLGWLVLSGSQVLVTVVTSAKPPH